MPNGILKLYKKSDNTTLVDLDILGNFNIEDNLNETPSNMKVKAITSNTYREEFEVNTIAYHADTNTWWVIKSDESTYLHTGEYEHEINLVEFLEFYSYRHLPNCAFAPNTYELEDMMTRLFQIAKLSITTIYPSFLDKDKIMPFMSFENFTVANAIKHIARALNAIPKMYVDTTSGFVPTLTFINRQGLDTAVVNTLNTQFPVAYERNTNSSDQFVTRSVSNITNAKSSALVVSPLNGGYKNISKESPLYNSATAKVYLPSKIDKVENLYVFPRISLVYVSFDGVDLVYNRIFSGYYFDKQLWFNKLVASLQPNVNKVRLENGTDLTIPGAVYTDLLALTNSVFPEVRELAKVNSTDTISTTYDDTLSPWFKNKMTIKSRFDFNTEDSDPIKLRTCYYETNTNEITMSQKFREGLAMPGSSSINSSTDINPFYKLYRSSTTIVYDSLYLLVDRDTSGFFNNKSYTPNYLIQVEYYPIADIKVSIDNDDDSQDEKFFNQSGKVIDAMSVSRLITSHTNDSVIGTKIRNAKYTAFNQILGLGQIVRDSNQLYIISQRSIDAQIKNGNEYYNVLYTLSRNRVARSENIVADSAVISYKIPDDNLVSRTQLYKDYIELSLTDGNHDVPYLSMLKALIFGDFLAGTRFEYTVVARNEFGSSPTTIRYVQNPSVFDLHKAKLMNVNWQDNNVLGYRVERNSNLTPIQTPILYTDNTGKATNFELLFLDQGEINEARADFNDVYTSKKSDLIPFDDLTNVDNDYYTNIVLSEGYYSIRIQENANGGTPYKKDAFEIPVFEYMIQANDDYDSKGNIVVGNDLFTTFTGALRYHFIINNAVRFTPENAIRLYNLTPPSNADNKRASFNRISATQIQMSLFKDLPPIITNRNDIAITNVGIYATDGTNVKFLFAINDYTMSSLWLFNIYINNWKI